VQRGPSFVKELFHKFAISSEVIDPPNCAMNTRQFSAKGGSCAGLHNVKGTAGAATPLLNTKHFLSMSSSISEEPSGAGDPAAEEVKRQPRRLRSEQGWLDSTKARLSPVCKKPELDGVQQW
jgi:hypothetical protein